MVERYEFNNKNFATFDTEQNLVSFNGKEIYKLKGQMKSISFRNKKNELDGIIIKTKDVWGRTQYIVINENEIHLRKCVGTCLKIIPTLEKDKNIRTKLVNDLKL